MQWISESIYHSSIKHYRFCSYMARKETGRKLFVEESSEVRAICGFKESRENQAPKAIYVELFIINLRSAFCVMLN